jgi:hypothetical protein
VEYGALLALNVAALLQSVRTVDGGFQKFHLGKPAGE